MVDCRIHMSNNSCVANCLIAHRASRLAFSELVWHRFARV